MGVYLFLYILPASLHRQKHWKESTLLKFFLGLRFHAQKCHKYNPDQKQEIILITIFISSLFSTNVCSGLCKVKN